MLESLCGVVAIFGTGLGCRKSVMRVVSLVYDDFMVVGWKSYGGWMLVLQSDASLVAVGCPSCSRVQVLWRLDARFVVGCKSCDGWMLVL